MIHFFIWFVKIYHFQVKKNQSSKFPKPKNMCLHFAVCVLSLSKALFSVTSAALARRHTMRPEILLSRKNKLLPHFAPRRRRRRRTKIPHFLSACNYADACLNPRTYNFRPSFFAVICSSAMYEFALLNWACAFI